MAGKQIYTSSLFVQSGSVAKFKSGITSSEAIIAGTVYANQYLDLNGNPVSSGGTQAVFFAGSGSGVSASNPFSQDHFFDIQGDLSIQNPNDANAEPIIAPGTVRIETTSSLSFTPNFYNFMKIGNNNEDLITVQQGTNPTYIVDNPTTQIDELKAGTHRYIIYAADTNPGGSTHQVYHTVTLTAFVNEAPELVIPTGSIIGSPVTMSLDHDSNSKDLILHFTNSTDPNQEQGELDFIKIFSASRQTNDPTIGSDTDASDGYTLNLLHTTTTEFNNSEGDQTIATQSLTPGLAEAHSPGALHFTASLTNYDATNVAINTIKFSEPQEERFTIEIQDDYPTAETPGITKASVTMSIVPPPTSSISNIKVLFSGTNNTDGDNETLENSHTHTILYDRTQSLDSAEIASLDKRYTSSIVKVKVSASITEPPGFNVVPEDHTTRLIIQSSSTNVIDSAIDTQVLGAFLFSGSNTNETVTASHYSNTLDGSYTPLDENHFYVLTESIDVNTKSDRNIFYGAHTSDINTINKTNYIQHGNHNHYEAFLYSVGGSDKLTLKACPEIKIDDIVVEVESGSFATNTGHPNLTSSLLYNLTSSIFSSQTSSLFSNFTPGQEPYNQYVSQSIVRLRIKSKITEPFGPDHNEITASFKVSGDNTIGTTTEAIIKEAKFSISPENEFTDLGSTDTNTVNTTLNLSSLLDSELIIDSDDYVDVTLEVEKIEVRGDLGPGNNGTETISNFELGGKSFGDNVQLTTGLNDKLKANWDASTSEELKITDADVAQYAQYEPLDNDAESSLFGDHTTTRTFDEYGRDGTGDWNVFITAWTGSIGGNRIVDLNQAIGNNGTINVSFDPNNGINYDVYRSGLQDYYQFRITFKATYETITTSDTDITEVTDFESIKIPFNTESAYNSTYTTDHDYSEFSGKELLVSSYTSSWYEFIQKPGVNQFSAVFSSQSNAGTNLNTSTSQSAEVSMSVVPSIKINDLVYETETYGYSGEAATDTSVRTVLYGDAHITNDGTGSGESGYSWRNHETASVYASHSVSRFRVKGIITEPVGPSINGQISASLMAFRSDNPDATYFPFTTIGIPIDYTTTSPTNDTEDIFSSVTTLVDNQLVTVFTSSWTGSKLTLPDTQRSAGDEQDFTISGSIIYVPDSTYEGGNNGIEILNSTTNTIKVKQTPEITVNSIKLVSETHGYSEIETQDTTRTVLYGDAQTTNSTSASKSWESHQLSGAYASQSVSRFKLTVKVTEPLGPLHYGSSNYRIWDSDTSNYRYSSFYFNTGSSELADFDWVDYKLSATYTSSWIGLELPTTLNSNFVRRLRPRILHIPPNNPSTTTIFVLSGSDVNVIDTPPAEIRDLVVESETEGYSGVATTNTTSRTVLYGQTTTNTGTGSGETGASLVGHSLADEFAKKSVSRFRYRFKVVEPIGPLHHSSSVTPKIINPASVESFLNSKTFNTSSTKVIDEAHFDPYGTSADSNKLIYTVTSSFSGSALSSNSSTGQNYTYKVLSSNISHTAPDESPNNYTALNNSYILTVKDTPQTQISEVFYETETFGYSGIITQNTTRSILYGDNHETNDGTGSGDSGFSWRNHNLADTYASHSVLRTKVRAKVTEPLGPLHHETKFVREFTSETLNKTLGNLLFNTGSSGATTELDSSNKRVTRYTSSFDGVQLTSNLQNGTNYTFTGRQEHTPSTEDDLLVTMQPAAKSKILVKDTPDTQIIIGDVDIETLGESGIVASNHESSTSIPDTHTRVVLHAEQNTRPTGSSMANPLFTGSAVLRTNVEAKIIEPLGPLHHAASMSVFYDASDSSQDDKSGPLINFSTGSDDILNRSFGYDLEGRLTASYTSSFTGSELPPMPHYEMKILDGNITFNPSTENGFTRTDASSKPTNFIKVEQGANHTINNFFIEVENSNSGSNVGNRIERSTNVLHGNTGSETNLSVNSGYPEADDREQLVSFRVLSSVVYPPAEEHFTSKFTVSKSLFTSNLPFTSTTVASKILNLNTGSGNSDVYLSQVLPTTTQGTTVNYTSSWFPVLFDAQGNTGDNNAEKNVYLVSSSFDGVFGDSGFSFTPSTLAMTSNTISVYATGAFSSSITADFGTGSLISASFFNSSDSEKSLYVIYPENGGDYQEIQVFPENVVTTPPTFTSESNLAFPNNLNITASSNNVNFSFANDGSNPLINDPANGTASIFIYNPSNYGNVVDSSLITLGIKDQETGSGELGISQSIFVIPKAPQTMSGDFDMVIDAHPTEMEDKFYFGLLASESLVNYSGSDADKPQNPTSIVSSSRILFVSTSTGYNYSMSLFTHTNDNPLYSTHATNEAFNFGDSGSLELKINGTSKTQVNLQSNFNASNKNTTQTLSGYDNNYSSYTFNNGTASFTEGKLIITKVAPFSNVSQSISKGGYSLNNGYQGFGVKIELDDRIRAGYNHLELIHNIADGFTQSMNVFDWYYNDGVETPSIKPNENLSYTEISNTPATHSLSGVSYFKDLTSFTASISNIYNLANKVYHHSPDSFISLVDTFITHDGELAVTTDGATLSNVSSIGTINHTVDPNISNSRKGLRFHEGDDNFIPTAQSTASINYIFSTALSNNVDPIKGKSYDLDLRFKNRTKTSEHFYSIGGPNLLNTGRFMKSGSAGLNSLTTVSYVSPNVPSMTASFFDEDRRWASASIRDFNSTNPGDMGGTNNDYTFWLDPTRANYDSTQNITSTNDLQQLYTGKLIFPSESYDGNLPNTVDYSTVTKNEQRYYYTAIKADTSLSSKNFTLIVSGNLNKNDFPFSANQNALDGNINIFVKLPGPINTDFSSNDGNTPGTGFGSVTGTKGGLSSFVKDENCKIAKGLDTTLTGPDQVAFKFSFGQSSAEFCNDVILVRVAMSGSIHPTGSIKQISIQSR